MASTARFIAYDIRPAKQIERRLMLDILNVSSRVGHNISDYQYVGMGGVHFVDFKMIHRHFAIQHMTSIEGDAAIVPRCKANAPYAFIRLHEGEASTYLTSLQKGVRYFIWLDYDYGLGTHVQNDLAEIASAVALGSYVFVTINMEPSGSYKGAKSARRREMYIEDMGPDYFSGYGPDDFEYATFPNVVSEVTRRILHDSFSERGDGCIGSLMRARYKDSSRMLTFGGVFDTVEIVHRIKTEIGVRFPFLGPDGDVEIPSVNYTDKERRLMDFAATSEDAACPEREVLLGMGFDAAEIDRYKALVRFLPRYFESYL